VPQLRRVSDIPSVRTCPSLTLPEATVKRRLANLYAEMEVRSRGEALSEGWFTARDPGSATGKGN
jgi:hypothetical protein